MIDISIVKAALFSPQSIQEPDSWIGHIPFAAWLIQQIHPKIFVELGTHSGNSYFGFCQSVLESGLSTKCYAVDTWEGDAHSGKYSEEIFEAFQKNHHLYAHFSRLLRMTFDDAAHYFVDQSIDLLHIDGFHTYEAVSHDFELWLPKLAPGAVVLFHDTNVRENGFGVWKFWSELQTRYPNHLEFTHAHGLGVLQLNQSKDDQNWLSVNDQDRQLFVSYFAKLGSRVNDQFDLIRLKSKCSEYSNSLAEKDAALSEKGTVLVERDAVLAEKDAALREKDAALAEKDAVLADKDAALAEKDAVLAEKDAVLAEKDAVLAEKDAVLAEKDAKLILSLTILHDIKAIITSRMRGYRERWPLCLMISRKKAPKRQEIKLCRESSFFDHNWYLSQYRDVYDAGLDPIVHYLVYGAVEGRDPGPNFSTMTYLIKHPSLIKSRVNPLVHYEKKRV